jgi:hypothetical protein
LRNFKLTVRKKNIKDMYRGISDFKNGYQPRINRVKDEKSNFVAYSHNILAKWRNHFSQPLNIYGIDEVKQTEIQAAELLVLEPSVFEVVLAIEKLKSHKSPGIDQIPA